MHEQLSQLAGQGTSFVLAHTLDLLGDICVKAFYVVLYKSFVKENKNEYHYSVRSSKNAWDNASNGEAFV